MRLFRVHLAMTVLVTMWVVFLAGVSIQAEDDPLVETTVSVDTSNDVKRCHDENMDQALDLLLRSSQRPESVEDYERLHQALMKEAALYQQTDQGETMCAKVWKLSAKLVDILKEAMELKLSSGDPSVFETTKEGQAIRDKAFRITSCIHEMEHMDLVENVIIPLKEEVLSHLEDYLLPKAIPLCEEDMSQDRVLTFEVVVDEVKKDEEGNILDTIHKIVFFNRGETPDIHLTIKWY